MGIKTGALIKEARTNAKISQTKLADTVGLTASEIGKAEKGEKELTQAMLKKIAVAVGCTQKSLIDAAKEDAADAEKAEKKAKKEAAAKAKAEKEAAAKKAAAKKSTAKKTASKKTAEEDELTLTAAEKKLVTLYRAASSDVKKQAVSLLKGETAASAGGLVSELLSGSGVSDIVSELLKGK